MYQRKGTASRWTGFCALGTGLYPCRRLGKCRRHLHLSDTHYSLTSLQLNPAAPADLGQFWSQSFISNKCLSSKFTTVKQLLRAFLETFLKFVDDHDVLSFLTFQLTEPGKEPVSILSSKQLIPSFQWCSPAVGFDKSDVSLGLVSVPAIWCCISPRTLSVTCCWYVQWPPLNVVRIKWDTCVYNKYSLNGSSYYDFWHY